MLDPIIEILPALLALVVPAIVGAFRTWITDNIPKNLWPVIIPVAGGFIAAIGTWLGIDTSALQETSTDPGVWSQTITSIINGALIGSAGVGVHQVYRQQQKKKAA